MDGPSGPRGQSSASTVEDEKPLLPCPAQYIDYNNYLEPRPGHTHAGEDFTCPCGTPMIACEDGVAQQKSDPSGYGTYIDLNVGKYVLRYAHLQEIKKTGNVQRGEVIGISGNTGGSMGCHLHFEVRTDGGGFGDSGTIAPQDYLTGAVDPGGGAGGGGTPTGTDATAGGGAGSLSAEDIFAVGRAAAISTSLELPGLLNYEAAMLLKGDKSIYNDQPLLPFIQQLAQASLRHFQSLPNGAFFSFFPDYFGAYNHRDPYWEIDDVEIVDGKIDLNDEALATHVFVVGDTIPDGEITIPEMISSKGVVTIYDAFASSFMFDASDAEKNLQKDRKVLNRARASQFLKRYGVRPHYEEATFVRNPMFEVFYAFTQFQLLWSRQFVTQFSFTFMPELYPGGVVAFPNHHLRCYIDSVTHTFDYSSGFVTQANLSAPAGYGSNAPSDMTIGMIQPLTKKELALLEVASNAESGPSQGGSGGNE